MRTIRLFGYYQKRALAYAVQHETCGKPTEVLKYDLIAIVSQIIFHLHCDCRRVIVDSIRKPGPNEVALKILAAPINPSDINMVILRFYFFFCISYYTTMCRLKEPMVLELNFLRLLEMRGWQ
jgi:hypothetical protein